MMITLTTLLPVNKLAETCPNINGFGYAWADERADNLLIWETNLCPKPLSIEARKKEFLRLVEAYFLTEGLRADIAVRTYKKGLVVNVESFTIGAKAWSCDELTDPITAYTEEEAMEKALELLRNSNFEEVSDENM